MLRDNQCYRPEFWEVKSDNCLNYLPNLAFECAINLLTSSNDLRHTDACLEETGLVFCQLRTTEGNTIAESRVSVSCSYFLFFLSD